MRVTRQGGARGLGGGMGGATTPRSWLCGGGALTALAVLCCGVATPAWSQETPTAAAGHTYASPVSPGPSADKPQSKLWYHDGSWWAVMLNQEGTAFSVWERTGANDWVDRGPSLDPRASSHADVLADGNKLYVASTLASSVSSAQAPMRLYRLTYDPDSRSYSRDPDFPVEIPASISTKPVPETVTVAREAGAAGRLWVAYEQGLRVWVTHSSDGGATWATPFSPPELDTAVTGDDIPAVVSLGGAIGVMWSDQQDGDAAQQYRQNKFSFATHGDSSAPSEGWQYEVPLSGTELSDDHLNLKLGGDGRLYAAVKTSKTSTNSSPDARSVVLLVREPGTGAWSSATYSIVADKLSRPVVSLDEESERVIVFAAREGGGSRLHYKSAPMDAVAFGPGPGHELMNFPGASINNPTSTKQPVDWTTDSVVLASDEPAARYYHGELSLGPVAPTPGIDFRDASFGANPTASQLTIATPARAVPGDTMVAAVSVRTKPTIAPPPGWTRVRADQTDTGAMSQALYWKRVEASEPSSHTWTFGSSRAASGGIVAYDDVGAVGSPVDAHGGQANPSSSSIVAPSVDTTAPGTMLVGAFGIARATNVSQPSTMRERGEVSSTAGAYKITTEIADEPRPGAGPTGTRTAVAAGSARNVGQLVALSPEP